MPLAEKAGMKRVSTGRFARAGSGVTGPAPKLVAANPEVILVVASRSAAAMPQKGLAEHGDRKAKFLCD